MILVSDLELVQLWVECFRGGLKHGSLFGAFSHLARSGKLTKDDAFLLSTKLWFESYINH